MALGLLVTRSDDPLVTAQASSVMAIKRHNPCC